MITTNNWKDTGIVLAASFVSGALAGYMLGGAVGPLRGVVHSVFGVSMEKPIAHIMNRFTSVRMVGALAAIFLNVTSSSMVANSIGNQNNRFSYGEGIHLRIVVVGIGLALTGLFLSMQGRAEFMRNAPPLAVHRGSPV